MVVRPVTDPTADRTGVPRRSVAEFLDEAKELLLGPVSRPAPPGGGCPEPLTATGDGVADVVHHKQADDGHELVGLQQFAARLKEQFSHALRTDPATMLPSHNHHLPTGRERGRFLTLDVGGSTLRVALVQLHGSAQSTIVGMHSFKITSHLRALRGAAFFDWLADKMLDTIPAGEHHTAENPLSVGLAWSFPIEQTSSKGGKLCQMGKGFLAADGLVGQDLGTLITHACARKGLHVELAAIVNDSSAALLSEAYASPTTHFGLVLGTGVNMAVYLPTPAVAGHKYGSGERDDAATHVIVNTELSLFGAGILPLTRWDRALDGAHPRPGFQPFEHLVSGMYLGEIARIALVEAVEDTGLLGGVVPPSLLTPYVLDTETLSHIEGDTTPSLEIARSVFHSRHPSLFEPTTGDMRAVRTLVSFISRRSASILAAAIFALWEIKVEAEAEAQAAAVDMTTAPAPATVGFNGSVIELYPGYQAALQRYLDGLLALAAAKRRTGREGRDLANGGPGGPPAVKPEQAGSITLVKAKESSLLGAAVALVLARG